MYLGVEGLSYQGLKGGGGSFLSVLLRVSFFRDYLSLVKGVPSILSKIALRNDTVRHGAVGSEGSR